MSIKNIGSTGRGQRLGKSKKGKKTSSAEGAGFADMVGGADNSSNDAKSDNISSLTAAAGGAVGSIGNITNISGVSGVDALLSLQETNIDANGRNVVAITEGENILNQLELLRLSILNGEVPIAVLQDISQKLENRQKDVEDEGLSELLDQIELRARVELAKLGH